MPTRQQAENDACQVRDEVWGEQRPVDPIRIALDLGLSVYAADLGPGTSGKLVKKKFEDARIYVARQDALTRQRFSVAHELGHWSRRAAEDHEAYEFVDERSQLAAAGVNPDEIYANQFAAELLMPAGEITAARPATPASVLAHRYGVSLEAMNFRLSNLGV